MVSSQDVSVVVCVRNGAALLEDCLCSIKENHPKEIIVVDGNSADHTVLIAERYAERVVSDEGQGLAFARNLGSQLASGSYVMFIGPDHRIPPGFIEKFVCWKEKTGYAMAGAQTRMESRDTWLDKMADLWRLYFNQPGSKNVVGTPQLFSTETLRDIPFASSAITCDDTDIAERIRAGGYSVGLVPVVAYEVSGTTWNDMVKRFVGYGGSDADFYALNWRHWSTGRKIISLMHPFRQFLRISVWSFRQGHGQVIFFLFLIMILRYYGWADTVYKNKTGSQKNSF